MKSAWTQDAGGGERGSALIPALMIVSMCAMLGLSMLSAGLSGSKVAVGQADEHRLASAVESAGTLAANDLWAAYLRSQGGTAGTIASFRAYLSSIGIEDSGPGGPPAAGEGVDLLPSAGLPQGSAGAAELDDVTVDALDVVRRDDQDATRLYLTVSATTKRGQGLASPALDRAVQLVYTVEPAPFDGFDYGILTKNVNCVFCHTVVQNAELVYNHDASLFDSFAKVKVGTLESLMLRTDNRPTIGDFDADSLIAGTLYVRGSATNQHGSPISSWGSLAMHSAQFDGQGNLLQDAFGNVLPWSFHPAGDPPQPGENLYLDYPTVYPEMPDGMLPTSFPPPFPDDGGIDPVTGQPTSVGAGNQIVDAGEFHAVAMHADGTISSGAIHVAGPGETLDTTAEYLAAIQTGNVSSLASTAANVVLTGTQENPIQIDGTVAIDGDVVISGWIQGQGSIVASGNVYVPTSLQYLDGHVYLEGDAPGHPTGPQTFGVAQDGTPNVLGLAAGGNVLIGDYLAPSPGYQPDGDDIVTGSSDGTWNFALAEIALFNRTEWSHTQPFLPAQGENPLDPSSWTAENPYYLGPDYVPHYYQFGPGDEIPIYNLGDQYFDPATGTWIGPEVPSAWDLSQLTLLDPSDTSNPLLFDQETGAPAAAILQLTSTAGWLPDDVQKAVLELYAAQHPHGTPVQIDGLLYTNHAIFGVVPRSGPAQGQIEINGSLVCADLGMLAPGVKVGVGQPGTVPGSPYKAGLTLNYDERTKGLINVQNPFSVAIKRTLWSPTAGVL